jgi:hypothetical protein
MRSSLVAALVLAATQPLLAQETAAPSSASFGQVTLEKIFPGHHDMDERVVFTSAGLAQRRFISGGGAQRIDASYYLDAIRAAVSHVDRSLAGRLSSRSSTLTIVIDSRPYSFGGDYDAKSDSVKWAPSLAPLAALLDGIASDIRRHIQRRLLEGTVHLSEESPLTRQWVVRIEEASGKLSEPVDVDPGLFRPLDGQRAAVEVMVDTRGPDPDEPRPTTFFAGLRARATKDFTVELIPDSGASPSALAVHAGDLVNVMFLSSTDDPAAPRAYIVVPVGARGTSRWKPIAASAISFDLAAPSAAPATGPAPSVGLTKKLDDAARR